VIRHISCQVCETGTIEGIRQPFLTNSDPFSLRDSFHTRGMALARLPRYQPSGSDSNKIDTKENYAVTTIRYEGISECLCYRRHRRARRVNS
jgi:hypothetical protein